MLSLTPWDLFQFDDHQEPGHLRRPQDALGEETSL